MIFDAFIKNGLQRCHTYISHSRRQSHEFSGLRPLKTRASARLALSWLKPIPYRQIGHQLIMTTNLFDHPPQSWWKVHLHVLLNRQVGSKCYPTQTERALYLPPVEIVNRTS